MAVEPMRQTARRKHTPERVINKLRQAEASQKIAVTKQTFYRFRRPLQPAGQ